VYDVVLFVWCCGLDKSYTEALSGKIYLGCVVNNSSIVIVVEVPNLRSCGVAVERVFPVLGGREHDGEIGNKK